MEHHTDGCPLGRNPRLTTDVALVDDFVSARHLRNDVVPKNLASNVLAGRNLPNSLYGRLRCLVQDNDFLQAWTNKCVVMNSTRVSGNTAAKGWLMGTSRILSERELLKSAEAGPAWYE